ncbi:MAG: nickel pincer cofactor biosynthesis protein LarC [Acidobacteria bacterium]|nr:MAG: nickel pincer cofactor biosynthesis protein LarC [Acidobacteriota bacterium]
MRTLYFDCFSGASGDMINGALLDLGVSLSALKEEIGKLSLGEVDVETRPVHRCGLRALKFDVRVGHAHQPERRLSDILELIGRAPLPEPVIDMACRIFRRLGEAEARAHGIPLDRVHFHEVGAVDAIVDIVGACLGFHLLGVERFTSSALNVGRGMTSCAHGPMPVPGVATAELLKGAPIYSTDVEVELVTPTGAAIISTVCHSYGPLPTMRLERVGYGAGTRELSERPNVLRLLLGEAPVQDRPLPAIGERVTVIEANIDDMSPEILGYVMERALAGGALDIFYTPIQMKKNRPGVLVTILSRTEDRERLIDLLFRETTTIGLRYHEVERRCLHRRVIDVSTPYGPIRVKVSYSGDRMVNVAPEYEDCRIAAQKCDVPLRTVMEAAMTAFAQSAGGESGERNE